MQVALLSGPLAGGGPETYLRGLWSGLEELGLGFQSIVVGPPSSLVHHRATTARLNIPTRSLLLPRRLMPILGVALPLRAVARPYPDVVHQVHLDWFPRVAAKRLILTVHDFVALDWSDEGALSPAARAAIGGAGAVVTGAEAVRRRIITEFGRSEQSVFVAPHGVDHARFALGRNDDALLAALGVPNDFLLYIGGVSARKNTSHLLSAHDVYAANRARPLPLVLAGPWARDTIPAADHRVRLGPVAEEAVGALYRRARAAVTPSLDEGYGLGVLEAQAAGAVLIASAIPTHLEIGGEAVYWIDPRSRRDLAALFLRVELMSEAERRRRGDEGRRHAAAFTWRRSAESHLRAYEFALAKKSQVRRTLD